MMSTGEYKGVATNQHVRTTAVDPVATNQNTTSTKVCFYIAQYPVRWTTQCLTLFVPWQTCSFRHQLAFSGKHSSHAAITSEDC